MVLRNMKVKYDKYSNLYIVIFEFMHRASVDNVDNFLRCKLTLGISTNIEVH